MHNNSHHILGILDFPALISLQKAWPEDITDVSNLIWFKYIWIMRIFTIILYNKLFPMSWGGWEVGEDYIAASTMYSLTGINQKLPSWLAVSWPPIMDLFLPLPSKGEVLASPLWTAVLDRPAKIFGNFQVTIKLPMHIFDLVIKYNRWAISRRMQKFDNK